MINRSVFTGNSQAGIEADGASVELNVSNSVSSNNAFGVQNLGGTPTIRLSNNDIAFNRTAFTGVVNSFTNNRLFGNLELGTSPTPIGQTSNASGLQ
jgi:hypothetical protein